MTSIESNCESPQTLIGSYFENENDLLLVPSPSPIPPPPPTPKVEFLRNPSMSILELLKRTNSTPKIPPPPLTPPVTPSSLLRIRTDVKHRRSSNYITPMSPVGAGRDFLSNTLSRVSSTSSIVSRPDSASFFEEAQDLDFAPLFPFSPSNSPIPTSVSRPLTPIPAQQTRQQIPYAPHSSSFFNKNSIDSNKNSPKRIIRHRPPPIILPKDHHFTPFLETITSASPSSGFSENNSTPSNEKITFIKHPDFDSSKTNSICTSTTSTNSTRLVDESNALQKSFAYTFEGGG